MIMSKSHKRIAIMWTYDKPIDMTMFMTIRTAHSKQLSDVGVIRSINIYTRGTGAG